MSWVSRAAAAGLSAVAAVAARDLLQREHTLLRNFPVLGHARYLLEAVGPELRQYLVAGNNEERPFTRDQRRWVYASAKLQNNDMITEINNQPVTDPTEFKKLYEQIRKDKPKDAVVLVVQRESNTQAIRIEPPQ